MPVSATASSLACSGGRSVSSRITSATASAQRSLRSSTRSRTACSFVRSDSKTSRNGSPSRAANSKVGGHRRGDPLLVVVRARKGLPHRLEQLPGVLVEEREVELQLAGEVLVENG